MRSLLIYGFNPFSRLIRNLARSCGREVGGYIDDVHAADEVIGGRNALNDFKASETDIILAIGYRHLTARRQIHRELSAAGFGFPSLIHPNALVGPDSTIAEGTLVMAGANIDSFCTIGPLCVIWPEATVSHDCVLHGNTFVSPNATICGFATIGEGTFIGAGSVIADRASVLPDAFIRAGSVYHTPRAKQ